MTIKSIFVTFLHLVVADILRCQGTAEIRKLHIGGLYPFTGVNNGRQSSMKGDLIQQAVTMAVEDVGKKGILPGYQLQLHVNDTQVIAQTKS